MRYKDVEVNAASAGCRWTMTTAYRAYVRQQGFFASTPSPSNAWTTPHCLRMSWMHVAIPSRTPVSGPCPGTSRVCAKLIKKSPHKRGSSSSASSSVFIVVFFKGIDDRTCCNNAVMAISSSSTVIFSPSSSYRSTSSFRFKPNSPAAVGLSFNTETPFSVRTAVSTRAQLPSCVIRILPPTIRTSALASAGGETFRCLGQACEQN